MKARVLPTDGVLAIVDVLRAAGREVIAPFAGRGRDSCFDAVTDENREGVRLHVANPYFPPKRHVFPPIEQLLRIRRHDGTYDLEAAGARTPRALFGVRSCDIAGIHHLDRFFLGGAQEDTPYARRRALLFLVNVVCTDPERDIGPECFCLCTDTGPAAREHFDLQLMDLGDGDCLAVAGSAAGEALFDQPFFRRATPGHVERRRRLLDALRQRFTATPSWFPAIVRSISRGEVLEATWEEIGRRCIECGGCTYVCPACTCFTVADRRLGPDEFERVRLWDSCALGGFTRMAGGHNPRKAVHDRRNRRFFRKLAHPFIRRELAMACVGCGRCAAVCHGDIGMPSVVGMIRRATAPSAEPDPGRSAPP